MMSFNALFTTNFFPGLVQDNSALLLACWLIGLLWLEQQQPRSRSAAKNLKSSLITNLLFFFSNSLLFSLLSITSVFALSEYLTFPGFLVLIDHPVARLLIAFIGFDLMFYAWHWACHRYDRLWIMHRIHHNELYLNASTGLRVHLLELLLATALKALYLIVMGLKHLEIVAFETVMALFVLGHHANIRLPFERWLGFLFITPSIHRSHHAVERRLHDCNLGAVFSLWDRLFGTFTREQPETIGLAGPSPQAFKGLWLYGLGLPAAGAASDQLEPNPHMVAEAAYYRAEKRGFNPGRELDDWLAAERDLAS